MTTRALSRTFFGLSAAALLALLTAFAATTGSAATPTFDANCTGCHATPPSGGRWNAAAASAVICAANTNHGMGIGGLSGATLSTITAEIDTVISSSQSVSAN